MGLISELFQPWAVLGLAVLCALVACQRWAWVPVACASLTTHYLKPIFAVPRPEGALVHEATYSFPSGHATAIAALACLLVVLWPRWWAALVGVFLALLVGYSRMCLGVHRPVEILAGYLVGALWVLGYWWVMRLGQRGLRSGTEKP